MVLFGSFDWLCFFFAFILVLKRREEQQRLTFDRPSRPGWPLVCFHLTLYHYGRSGLSVARRISPRRCSAQGKSNHLNCRRLFGISRASHERSASSELYDGCYLRGRYSCTDGLTHFYARLIAHLIFSPSIECSNWIFFCWPVKSFAVEVKKSAKDK